MHTRQKAHPGRTKNYREKERSNLLDTGKVWTSKWSVGLESLMALVTRKCRLESPHALTVAQTEGRTAGYRRGVG